ncbi:MAG: histone deacetylase family protein [Alphaproteobacteria bacterium]|nr:histone deacetylase family protein [Alphaproteobacteria bacterium]
MTTALFSHDACHNHDTGQGHPEQPARYDAVMAALAGPEFVALARREAPKAGVEQIARVHPRAYVEAMLASVPEKNLFPVDTDTILSPGSGKAMLRSAGAGIAAVDAVMAGEVQNAFCVVRPPGHHAEPQTPMGFCFFNNIAIAAAHALAAHKLERVALVDFDVHHGNGTQTWAEREPRAFFCSTHQSPLYPGTGMANEHGGHGNILNVPLPAGAGGKSFMAAIEGQAVPALEAWKPQILFISAGFDAHANDPLAGMSLLEEDFAAATRALCAMAARQCGGRVVSVLEGGYNIDALARSAAAHVLSLMEAGKA